MSAFSNSGTAAKRSRSFEFVADLLSDYDENDGSNDMLIVDEDQVENNEATIPKVKDVSLRDLFDAAILDGTVAHLTSNVGVDECLSQQRRDRDLKERELKERELKERELKERELKERELKERELKERELKERELKEREPKERELKEREIHGGSTIDSTMTMPSSKRRCVEVQTNDMRGLRFEKNMTDAAVSTAINQENVESAWERFRARKHQTTVQYRTNVDRNIYLTALEAKKNSCWSLLATMSHDKILACDRIFRRDRQALVDATCMLQNELRRANHFGKRNQHEMYLVIDDDQCNREDANSDKTFLDYVVNVDNAARNVISLLYANDQSRLGGLERAGFATINGFLEEEYLEYAKNEIRAWDNTDDKVLRISATFIVAVRYVAVQRFHVLRDVSSSLQHICRRYLNSEEDAAAVLQHCPVYVNLSVRKDCKKIDLLSSKAPTDVHLAVAELASVSLQERTRQGQQIRCFVVKGFVPLIISSSVG